METMDILQVMKHLPHRYPFLLIDRVISIDPAGQIRALKNVTINEPFFPGHFPHFPVMPGVLIIEAMAQASALLSLKRMGREIDDKTVYYFVGIDGARFKRPVVPGDQLVLESRVLRESRGLVKFAASASVGDDVVCAAELLCTMRSIA